MRAVIVGGAGFVGINIAEAMAKAGHDVTILDRKPLPRAAIAALSGLPGTCRSVEADVFDKASVAEALRGADLILGAAITAGPEREARDPASILQVNLIGHVAVIEAARDAGIRRIVNLSSTAAYGIPPDGGPDLDETMPCDPLSLYAITKWASERVDTRIASLWNLDLVSVRLSTVFGPWEHSTGFRDTLSPAFQIFDAATSGRDAILPRPALRDWIHAPDIADAVLRIATAPTLAHSLYNISTGRPFTMLAWGEALAAEMQGSGTSSFSCRLAEPGETATIDLYGSADRPSLAVSRLEQDLGWRAPTGMVESVRALVAWWRSHGEAMSGEGARS